MRALPAVLLASLLAAAAQGAPAPFQMPPRHVPSPEKVLARLRAEGLDVRGLKHQSGSRWVLETSFDVSDSASPRFVTSGHTIAAPGDPTDRLRASLIAAGRGPSHRMKVMIE